MFNSKNKTIKQIRKTFPFTFNFLFKIYSYCFSLKSSSKYLNKDLNVRNISVFDTSINSYNLGNEVIMKNVYENLRDIFYRDFIFKIPPMEINHYTFRNIDQSDYIFFGGTNSLSSRMEEYKQWGLNFFNSRKIKNVILMGLGWWQYQDEDISFYTKLLLRRSLSHSFLHAVRDSYTENKLREIGFNNVLNTGCPTLWKFDKEFCKKIKKEKSSRVVFTLTDYNRDVVFDKKLVDILEDNYDEVYFWVQGSGDYDYLLNKIKPSRHVKVIYPDLEKYSEILSSGDIDYIGTRLHAGIHAMSFYRRSLIIGIDNRSLEMNKDFNIPILKRDKIEELSNFINSSFETVIDIPIENINKWKSQFVIKK